ncbi:armadillo-type protein [Mycena capillaripes]|nr:armadillo-type protein [Mycena capillaripes]
MQPLARQLSRTSLLSWWSDSNPGLRGPTVNIHVMAKPLVRFLYHRQALQFIKGNDGALLTPALVEIYSTYLLCKYVSSETQREIMKELVKRAPEDSEAFMIVESSVSEKISQLLESSNWVMRRSACRLVRNLARHEAIEPRLLEINAVVHLVSCLEDEHPEQALNALANVAMRRDGAEVVVRAEAQNNVLKFLESKDSAVREPACRLVANLAGHETTVSTVLEINPFMQLVSCLK